MTLKHQRRKRRRHEVGVSNDVCLNAVNVGIRHHLVEHWRVCVVVAIHGGLWGY